MFNLNFIYQHHHHRVETWNQPLLAQQQLQLYADAIHAKGAPLDNCLGFCTVRRIARPKVN